MISPPLKVWVCLAFVFLGVLTVAQMARAADTQPPSVTITQPTNGSSIGGIVRVLVTATDNVAVANVSFQLDGAAVGTPVLSPPFTLFPDTARFINGVHSLLAVATDTAGNTRRSALVQITVTNQPLYKLGSGPFTVENLGCVLSANAEERQEFFRLSNDTHLLLYYIADYGTSPLQILDVNFTQGTARLTNSGAPGRPGYRGTVLYPNGKIYLGTSEANATGFLVEYNPTTGHTRQIAQISGTDTWFSEIGDDGWIYNGNFPCAYVDRYNPNTDTFERLGNMESETNTDFGSYAYTLGADSRYLYVGVGESPWFLVIYDTQTTNMTRYWATNGDSGGAVRHGTNGYWYYYRCILTPTYHVVWYQLTNGVPVQITNTPNDLLVGNAQRGNVVDSVANGYLVGYEVNLDYALPDSGSNYATIEYRTVGATNWQSVGIGGFHLAPSTVSRLYPWDGTRLMGFAFFYGPVFNYDINSHQTTTLGRPQCSLYDAIFGTGVDYFCGYTATTLRYDPSRPWTMTASAIPFSNTNLNPYKVSLAIGKHEFFMTFGADGMVYVAARHERDSAGGELGWYDPITGTNGSLRTPFLNDEPNDLKPALGGTKLVYASAMNPNLFVFDVATKSIDRTIAVSLPGVTNVDKVVEVAPGIMFGVTESNIFKVNITSGAMLYTNSLPGAAFVLHTVQYNHRLVLGPDGYVWLPVNQKYGIQDHTYIYRINPADGSMTNMFHLGFYAFYPSSLMFNGGDMYLYGATNLCRIQGLLIPVGPQPQALRVVPPEQ